MHAVAMDRLLSKVLHDPTRCVSKWTLFLCWKNQIKLISLLVGTLPTLEIVSSRARHPDACSARTEIPIHKVSDMSVAWFRQLQ